MNFLTESELRKLARESVKQKYYSYGDMKNIANKIILESNQQLQSEQYMYEIFLSHSFNDSEIVLGLKLYLENKLKLRTYVDWIDSPEMDRSCVNKDTAKKLKKNMKDSKSLIYATSDNSIKSRWMPWELGYFDGLKKGKIAILPITKSATDSFKGEEYLDLYDLVEKEYYPYGELSRSIDKSSNLVVKGKKLNDWIEE